MTAAAQLRRILHLIPTLADDHDHPIGEVAERAGVDRATLLRDLRSLAERFDDPGGFVEGVSIFVDEKKVSVHANHFLRPMRLTAAELCAVELGLAMLRAERAPEEHRAIDAARETLRKVIARLPADELADGDRHGSLAGDVDAALLGGVRAALRDRRKLQLAYRKADGRDAELRVVRPYTLVHASGRWYLGAYCERSAGTRLFRLDRIERVETLAERCEVPEDFSVEGLIEDGKALSVPAAGALVVRYSPRVARWIAEREGKPLEPDGSLTLAHPLADLGWAVRHVLQYGPDAEIVEPAEARETIRERLAAMAAAAAAAE